MLWGKAAGRCQFAGCNKQLWKCPVTQETVNIAQRAHIYSFSDGGPRGNAGISKSDLNELANLMLTCHACHKEIDKKKDGGRYPVELLRKWKQDHERRVEIVTGISPSKSSHVVLFGSTIGDHRSPLNFAEAAQALFPRHYPADDRPIELSMRNGLNEVAQDDFWSVEAQNLRAQFDRRVKERIEDAEISHLSVFGLAPQPLLIQLGTLLCDVTPAEVYQRHREPTASWEWPDSAEPLEFKVERPSTSGPTPALVIALSAPVSHDRVRAVLGEEASIWTLTVDDPNNDLIKSREQLSAFRNAVRKLFDEIKRAHGQETPLHVFPVGSVSTAIEFGRVRMPKAHMPWVLYDQVNQLGGFVRTIEITT